MGNRFYVDRPIRFDSGTFPPVMLTGGEAHHLIHVMRAGAGAEVLLFDGSGAEFPSRIVRVGRAEVELAVLRRQDVDRELPRHLALAVSLPKGDRQRWLVEKAVELGVMELVPLATLRSVAQPVQQALDRLRRAVIEASKQCGRNRLMGIAEPTDWPDFIEATRGEPQRLLAHPCRAKPVRRGGIGSRASGAEPGTGRRGTSRLFPEPADRVLVAVGPEGGLAPEEVAVAKTAGWHLVDLGPRILRTETAALVMATLAGA